MCSQPYCCAHITYIRLFLEKVEKNRTKTIRSLHDCFCGSLSYPQNSIHTLSLCPFQNTGGDAVSGTTHRRSAIDIPLGENVRSVLFMASYALLFYMPPHDLCLRTKVVYHLSCCFAVVLTTNQEKSHAFLQECNVAAAVPSVDYASCIQKRQHDKLSLLCYDPCHNKT